MVKYIFELIAFLCAQGYMIFQTITEGIANNYSAVSILIECIGMFIIISIFSLIIFAVFESDSLDVKPSDVVPKYSPYGRFLSRMENMDKKDNTK